jgi:hypothetical protein
VSNKYLKLNDDTNESDFNSEEVTSNNSESYNQNLLKLIKKPISILRFRKVVICILFAKRMFKIS